MRQFEIHTKIHFGENVMEDCLTKLSYHKVMVIADPFVVTSGMIDRVTKPLKKAGIDYEVFQDVVPDPPIEKIVIGVKALLAYQPEAIIAIGGGSAIDASKSIREFALRMKHYGDIALIAIPTTSGTGSEVTSFAVITDPETRIKYPLFSSTLTPDEAILDADLVRSVPPAITADTGMDVFTHALEAYVSTEQTEFSSALAEKAIQICGSYLLRAYFDGNDMTARKKMHSASCLAGLAFNSALLGLNHGMAHVLGASFHISHGRANAMLLPHIIMFNADLDINSTPHDEYLPIVERYAIVAQTLGLNSYNQVMRVHSLVNWIQFMLKEMHIPLSISEMGTISEEDYFRKLPLMAEEALADGCTPTNPRKPSKEQIMQIYKNLW